MACVLTCYYKPKPGGLCTRLFRTIQALLDRGHTVHYLSVIPFPISHPNIHHHRFPWPKSFAEGYLFWFFFFTISPFMLLYLGVRYNVSHAFAFTSSYGLILQLLRISSRIPLTIFIRGDSIHHYRLKGYPHIILFIESIFEGFAIKNTRVFFVSRTLLDRIKDRHRFLQPAYSDILPNDISEPDSFAPVNFDNKKQLNVACVGILEKLKNQEVVIRALAQTDHPHVTLLLYGVGPMENTLKYLATDLGIEERVIFMGWVSPSEEIWKNVDVLLYPSLYEGSPNAILEALSWRIPVIASDIPEHRELLPADSLIENVSTDNWISCFNNVFVYPYDHLKQIQDSQNRYSQKLRFDWNEKITSLILSENA